MLSAERGSWASAALDWIRGVAAMAVAWNHLRNLFLVDYHQLTVQNGAVKALYFITGLGHESVILFFVMSGFFISSIILRDLQKNRWSWSGYLLSRLTRLYLVLIPALLLTLFWDQLGIYWTSNGPPYNGGGDGQDVIRNAADKLTPVTFLGNVLFLQETYVKSFGTNGPVWSLANEFWYYLVFPCFALLLVRNYAWGKKGLCLVAAVLMMALLWPLFPYFPIWLMGAGLVVMPRLRALEQRWAWRAGLGLALAAFLAATALDRMHYFAKGTLIGDYVVGAAFTLVMYVLLHANQPLPQRWSARLGEGLAGMSYSLYLTHQSFEAFLAALIIGSHRWQPNAAALGLWLLIGSVVILYSYIVSRLTEAHTNELRAYFRRRLGL